MTYRQNRVHFDGMTHLRRNGPIGAATKSGTLSFWVEPTERTASKAWIVFTAQDEARISVNVDAIVYQDDHALAPLIKSQVREAFSFGASTDIDDVYPRIGTRYHVAFAWDLDIGAQRVAGYLDGIKYNGNWNAEKTLAWNVADLQVTIGDTSNSSVELPFNPFVGYMSDMWFDSSFLDLDVAGNMEKFIDANGNPVALGADGSLPLGGTPPLIFFGDTMKAEDWNAGMNRGSGGVFDELGGAVTDEPIGLRIEPSDEMSGIATGTGGPLVSLPPIERRVISTRR